MHILLVDNSNVYGGIPKVTVALANAMVDRGHRVTVLNQKPVSRFSYPLYKIGYWVYAKSLPRHIRPDMPRNVYSLRDMYPLSSKVDLQFYSFTDHNKSIQKLRKRIQTINPDACVCLFPDGRHLVWAVTLLGSGIPFVYSEHTSPNAIEHQFWTRAGRLAAMSGADIIHLLLPEYVQSIPDFLRSKVRVVQNPITEPANFADPVGKQAPRKVMLWLARLQEEVKQCQLAMDAFALLTQNHPDWDMHVVGDGPDRAMIQRHAETLKLGTRLKLLGHSDHAGKHYSTAQAYCLSSRTEGLPMSLLEAMSHGLPCVAFADCDGVSNVISHGENGLLARDMTVAALAREMDELMGNAQLRERLGTAARRVSQDYAPAQFYDKWETLLAEAAARKGHTVMDTFREEPFASQARLSSVARREWLWREFGQPMPGTVEIWLYYALWKPLCLCWKRLTHKETSHEN